MLFKTLQEPPSKEGDDSLLVQSRPARNTTQTVRQTLPIIGDGQRSGRAENKGAEGKGGRFKKMTHRGSTHWGLHGKMSDVLSAPGAVTLIISVGWSAESPALAAGLSSPLRPGFVERATAQETERIQPS